VRRVLIYHLREAVGRGFGKASKALSDVYDLYLSRYRSRGAIVGGDTNGRRSAWSQRIYSHGHPVDLSDSSKDPMRYLLRADGHIAEVCRDRTDLSHKR